MKKLIFVFAAFAALSFASCGNKVAKGTTNDSDSVTVDTVADTLATDSVDSVA